VYRCDGDERDPRGEEDDLSRGAYMASLGVNHTAMFNGLGAFIACVQGA
jgi:hypothetical protein